MQCLIFGPFVMKSVLSGKALCATLHRVSLLQYIFCAQRYYGLSIFCWPQPTSIFCHPQRVEDIFVVFLPFLSFSAPFSIQAWPNSCHYVWIMDQSRPMSFLFHQPSKVKHENHAVHNFYIPTYIHQNSLVQGNAYR